MAWVEALENVGLGTEDMAQWVRVPAVQSMSSSPQCPHIKKKKTLHPAWIVTPVIQRVKTRRNLELSPNSELQV